MPFPKLFPELTNKWENRQSTLAAICTYDSANYIDRLYEMPNYLLSKSPAYTSTKMDSKISKLCEQDCIEAVRILLSL